MSNHQNKFDWSGEMHKTVVQSLATSFGLDFLLFDDKHGGDVDTVHNVRNNIYATEQEKEKYHKNKHYNSDISDKYHKHENYINRGKIDKTKQKSGDLYDAYRDKNFSKSERRQLDHIISSHEVHQDAGRILAGVDGVDIANQEWNFNSTSAYINNRKSNLSMEEFIRKELPNRKSTLKASIFQDKQKLKNMPENTSEQRHNKREIKERIKKNEENLNTLENINEEKMIAADKEARTKYNQIIDRRYYSSSQFFQSTAKAAASSGFRMGLRQAIGLLLAEIWFELKKQIPNIFNKCKINFELKVFLKEVQDSINNIWKRIQSKFSDLIISFKDGVIAGIFSSITSTLMNIFFTTTKQVGKIIRESWGSLVQAVKLIFFNPDKLELGDLTKEVMRVMGTGASVIVGGIFSQTLTQVLTIPFGAEISMFLGSLVSGIMIVGLGYFLDYSALMKKVWSFLNQIKSKYALTLEYYQKINAELDSYLEELSKIEFNMNSDELQKFSDSLTMTNNECERRLILRNEIKKRNIDLPYDDNDESLINWLNSL